MVRSRSRWLFLVLFVCAPAVACAGESYRLEEPVDDTRVFGIGTRVDVNGKIQPTPKVEPLPLVASAALSYRERRLLGLGADSESLRSIRDYELTSSEIDVAGQKSTTELADKYKLIVANGMTDGVELYSLGGPLTSNELDLLRSPADSLALISLLPSKEVEIGAKWTAPGWAFQLLTALDAVVKGELTCTLASVENKIARVKFEGKLEGAALAAVSEITLSGFYDYDLNQKCITQCDLTQVEKRSQGPVSPAFEFNARVRLLRRPAQIAGRLGDPKIVDEGIAEPSPTAKLLRFDSKWNVGFEYPRHWHLWRADDKAAIFRLIDEGNFIAQCDLALITPAKPGEHLSEAGFQQDVLQALGDRIKNMRPGEVLKDTGKQYIYRIAATGADGDRPLNWVFYLVADPSGRQATMSVTVETPLAEALADRERELISNMRFGPAPASPTPRTTSR